MLSTPVVYFTATMSCLNPDSFTHPTLYFDTIAMVMTAVLLGKWLETMAKGRALKQLSALYELQVKRVRVLRSHGGRMAFSGSGADRRPHPGESGE